VLLNVLQALSASLTQMQVESRINVKGSSMRVLLGKPITKQYIYRYGGSFINSQVHEASAESVDRHDPDRSTGTHCAHQNV
jgi:hypothetical protein